MRRPLLLAIPFLLAGASAPATPITPAAFGPSAVAEGFEGLVLGPNVGTSPFSNILEPGKVSAYTFASGVTLSAPVPNPGTMSNGAFVHDFALPMGATNTWGANGSVSSAANVPFGTAYLGAFDNLGSGPVSLTLDFASPMLRAGAYVTGAAGTTVRLDVYGAGNVLLESRTLATVPVASWSTNFLGLERLEGIDRVVFTGTDFGLDGLTFEAVPEASTVSLLLLGLAAFAASRARQVRDV
ncbi:MAG TPA: PEP-CTERM sorting domain-containing protein [Myxococcota bacterium]|jgi:hypothetical protein|nr:PEP-CTERM sorting domain-containing protein [Myxococcota bacterium]